MAYINIDEITVPQSIMNYVKGALGYPITDEALPFTDEQIIEYVIIPYYEEFCNYFPTKNEMSIVCSDSSNMEIDVSDRRILGIYHYTLIGNNTSSNQNLTSGNPFYTASQISGYGASSSSYYGTPWNYGASTEYSYYQRKFLSQSAQVMNGSKVYSCKYDEINKKLIIHTAKSGTMFIRYGSWENDLNNIPNRLKIHFQDFAKGGLMKYFADIVNLMNTDLPLSIDADSLSDKADDILERERDFMKENSTIPLLR